MTMPDGSREGLLAVLDRDPSSWAQELTARTVVLDEVLAGRIPAVVYPAARLGQRLASWLLERGAKVVALGDGDPQLQGHSRGGLPVLSPADIAVAHANHAVLVASLLHDTEIARALASSGCRQVVPIAYICRRMPDFLSVQMYAGGAEAVADPANRSRIEAAFALFADRRSREVFVDKLGFHMDLDKGRIERIHSSELIYFDPTIYRLRRDEIVVDAGAFNGDTFRSFLGAASRLYSQYFAFEPDSEVLCALESTISENPDGVTIVRVGLGARSGEHGFHSTGLGDARLLAEGEEGGATIPIVSIDDYFRHRKAPTLIKMDIEGAELEALVGSQATMKRRAPVAAVSAYHRPSDLWEVPLLLHRLSPESQLYLRHYTYEVDDTVCYAVPQDRVSGRRHHLEE